MVGEQADAIAADDPTAVERRFPEALVADLEAELEALTPGEFGRELIDLSRLIDRLEATRIELIRRFDEARGYEREGTLSAVSWLRSMCRLPVYGAVQRLSMARQFADLPQTAAALREGRLGYQHAALIVRLAEQVGTGPVREREENLVATAAEVDPGRFGVVTNEVRYRLDADGFLDDATKQYERRQLWIRHMADGHYELDGRLDAEGGAVLRAALDAVEPPPTIGSGCTVPFYQREADALVDLARRLLEMGDLPQTGGQRPQLTVTATIETLAMVPGHPAGQLQDGSIMHAETVRRIACDASLTRIVMKGKSQPLDVGRATPTIPAAVRKALVARDRGCRFPYCQRKAIWTDGHHFMHWIEGGETKLDNLLSLCRRHHTMVHEGGWRLVWADHSRVIAVPPRRRPGEAVAFTQMARAG